MGLTRSGGGGSANAATRLVPTGIKTGAYTLAAGDLVLVDISSASFTVTVPSGLPAGAVWGVKVVNINAGRTATVALSGSEVFNRAGGSVSASLAVLGHGFSVEVQAGGVHLVESADVPLAQSDARYLQSSFGRQSPLLGVPITDNCFTTASSTAQTATGTSECPHDVLVDATDIRFVYANQYHTAGTGDIDNANPITIKAALRVGASTVYPVTFGGALSVSIAGGGFVQSDPLPVDVAAGAVIYSRTEVTPTLNWYPNHVAQFTTGMGGWTTTTGLTAAGSAAITESASSMYVPAQIIGRPQASLASPAAPRVVLITGDSLAAGSNDYTSGYAGRSTTTPNLSGGGYIQRALYAANIPHINSAVSSDQATYWTAATGHLRRWTWASAATSAICEYGRNDISNGRTLAQVQADLITIWTAAARRGLRVFQCTVTPLPTSTDGFATTTNQTAQSNPKEGIRTGLNDWVRDGAPVTSAASVVAVAVGTSGALRAGSPGHPLFGYFDAADQAETARNSGIWKTFSSRTVTDATWGASSGNLSSATANFTTADVGSVVTIVGGGASGATYSATITARNSASGISIGTNTSTAVASGGTLIIGAAGTRDGLHPSSPLAIVMSSAIDTTKIA